MAIVHFPFQFQFQLFEASHVYEFKCARTRRTHFFLLLLLLFELKKMRLIDGKDFMSDVYLIKFYISIHSYQ